jgi:hypothetical protein
LGGAVPESLKTFEPGGERDDRLNLSLPVYLRQALQYLEMDERPLGHVAQWALRKGVEWLEGLPEVKSIRSDYRVVAARTPYLTAQVESWGYVVTPRGGHVEALNLRDVYPKDLGACLGIARGIGLRNGTGTRPGKGIVATIAIMAGLSGVELPAELADQIKNELDMWCVWLHKRAMLTKELRTKAEAGPERGIYRQFSLADVGKLE